ncbi:MAG: phosphoserine phosphatase SerB [Porticoccaceae bacterium]|nr:phosphoserine phosphatase SerB [Porticoccaceae bacterium]MDB4581050.1 phosphoserine phosphatase SerB [Porticoccaceae bacterium]MDC0589361.1 phosphoserine phosphatase SerB [Porticoccaceae bacterium]MDG1081082.1 phosphoserine phosphatase SerB [Porticoccaceae bacterium]
MKELFLINVWGQDKPGVTRVVTEVLSTFEVTVLDIGQAVIHDQLNLGILAAVPAGKDSEALVKAVQRGLLALEIQVMFSPITEQRYQSWVAQQGKARYIVTLLARKIEPEHLAAVATVTSEYDLNIDKIVRLSGRMELDESEDLGRACVEFSVRGEPKDAVQFKSALLELASHFDIDIAYQEDNIFRRNRRLVVFDMDSTLIDAEVIDELAHEAGVGDQVAAITEAAMQGEIDFKSSFTQRMALLKGLDASVLQSVAERLRLNEGAEHLISTLKKLGFKTAIVSGGFTFFGEYLQQRLGVDYVYANQLDIDDGQVTGRVTGEIIDGQRKAELLREIAEREGLMLQQVIAVGDGANDLPMLSIAGLGIAFRAKPLVKASAKQSISNLGLDGILYLLGYSDKDTLILD